MSLFSALCNRERALLPKVFRAFATLPEELRPALLDGAGAVTGGFDGLVRLVGPECAPLLAVIADPPAGSESLAKRAIRVLADADAAERRRTCATPPTRGASSREMPRRTARTRPARPWTRSCAPPRRSPRRRASPRRRPTPQTPQTPQTTPQTRRGDAFEDVELLLPLLGAMSAEKVRSLVPRLVALPLDLFKQALDRLCGERAPLSPSEIFVALHEVDPARSGVGLKKIIAACGECFERPDAFGAETLASAMSKMVEMHPLPLLFMRTVIQAETAWPTLREFTVGVLRSLARRKVWKLDAKIWEGFARCARRRAAIVPGTLRDAGGASAGDSEEVSPRSPSPCARVRQRARGRGERSEGGQGTRSPRRR